LSAGTMSAPLTVMVAGAVPLVTVIGLPAAWQAPLGKPSWVDVEDP